jgi:hypothetical protein
LFHLKSATRWYLILQNLASSQSVQKGNRRTLQPLQLRPKHLLYNRSRPTRLKQSANIPSARLPLISSEPFEKPQPQQVRDRLPQTEQRDVSSKPSSSPRCRFSKHFSLSPGNSSQWRPLLPKEGGLIQVDISGHPNFPNGSKQFFGNFGNILFLASFNFWGHFRGPK